MAWIESHQSLERHPKTSRLMAGMDWDLDTTIGKLFRFWWWCVDYAQDGDLRRFNDAQLGNVVGLNGDLASRFVEQMVEACWLDRKPYFRVHDWWDYVGPFLRTKYKNDPQKWKAIRDAYKPQNDIPNGEGCDNGSNDGCNNPIPTNQPTNLNQPTPEEVGSMVGVVVGEQDPVKSAEANANAQATTFAKNWIAKNAASHLHRKAIDTFVRAIRTAGKDRAVESLERILKDPKARDPFDCLAWRLDHEKLKKPQTVTGPKQFR